MEKTDILTDEEAREMIRRDPSVLEGLPKFYREILVKLTGETQGIGQSARGGRLKPSP